MVLPEIFRKIRQLGFQNGTGERPAGPDLMNDLLPETNKAKRLGATSQEINNTFNEGHQAGKKAAEDSSIR